MTHPNDPYGYLPFPNAVPPTPAPGSPPMAQQYRRAALAGRPTGKQILVASWNMLQQQRSLLWLPLMSLGCALLAAGTLFVPGWLLGTRLGYPDNGAVILGAVFALFGLATVSIYFQAALVIGANMQADGYTPTLGTVLAAAWQRKGDILAWAFVSTTAGVVIRAIEQRLGLLGRLLGIAAGLAWAIATYLVVPVIIAEGLGPIDAVRRSSAIIKQRWGIGLRTTLRFGLIQFVLLLVPLFLIVCGAVTMSSGGGMAALGLLILLAGIVVLFAMSSVFSAITTYAQTMIYRHAVGRPVPIPVELMDGAFQRRRR
jgi:hypothetical protein